MTTDTKPASAGGGANAHDRPVPFQGDLRNLPKALDPLKALPNWVCWKFLWKVNDKGIGKWTKPPYRPANPQSHARNNDPSTWGTYEQALAAFEAGQCDGIGFNILGSNVAAFDIDKCRDRATGQIAPEALKIVDRASSYTEMTPSGTGLRVIGFGDGAKMHRKQSIPGSSVEVESYRGAERYITITSNPLPDSWPHMADINAEIDAVVAELDGSKRDDAGQGDGFEFKPQDKPQDGGTGSSADDAFLPEELRELIRNGVPPSQDRSASFHRAVCWLGEWGWSADRIERYIAGKPIVPPRFAHRLGKEIARCLHKAAKAKSNPSSSAQAIQHDDFYAYMLEHKYIYTPLGAVWPAASVDARLPAVGKLKASTWLDKNRPVEQMTWVPGQPVEIKGRLIVNGGWIERPGSRAFNLYRAPTLKPTAGNADRWVHHVERLYGEDAAHVVKWCAHRVQKPADKINHALVLGGRQGIGKDTLLEPVKYAVGAWNFNEVSPVNILGRFNGFLKSVVLRVSEARDLGDSDRFAFYDHMKSITAAPPDVLRIDEKNRQEYAIPNVCGVIITTNHKSDGIYLPADDRRHFVAWSDLDKSAFDAAYWAALWQWYAEDGLDVVAHYLQNLDLTGFNPKATPPQTSAFFEIVNSSRTPEDAEFADALDVLAWPKAVTIAALKSATPSSDFVSYLDDRRNSRRIPHRFEACGYTPVRNPHTEDGLWRPHGRRQVIYARSTLDHGARVRAAADFERGKPPPGRQ